MARKEEILTSAEARRYLKIGRTKLWQLTREQVIPCYRLGSSPNASLRYKRSELLRWLERNKLVPSDDIEGAEIEGADNGNGSHS